MQNGLLNKLIQVHNYVTSSRDISGYSSTTYDTASAWAAISVKGGNEGEANGLVSNQANYTFIVRKKHDIVYSDDVNAATILTYAGKKYKIVLINEPSKLYYELSTERQNGNK